MHADLTKVRQSLFNLLSNACKFTKEGTIRLVVGRAEGDGGGDWITFCVTDTGIGMTPEHLARSMTRTIVSSRRRPSGVNAAASSGTSR
jgi:signal transduction histidine kinase